MRSIFVTPEMVATISERLKRRINVDLSGCHVWQGAKTAKGYGVIGWGPRSAHTTLYVHRLSIWLATGIDRPCEVVMHSCDNPACCNPGHLSYGSAKDNSADMVAKGRVARGERSHMSKLTESDIPMIRSDNRSLSAIAATYGVDKKQVHRVKRRESWGHVT